MVVENRDFLPRNAIHRAIHKAAVWCPSVCPSCFCIVSKRETYLHILQQIHTTHERDKRLASQTGRQTLRHGIGRAYV